VVVAQVAAAELLKQHPSGGGLLSLPLLCFAVRLVQRHGAGLHLGQQIGRHFGYSGGLFD